MVDETDALKAQIVAMLNNVGEETTPTSLKDNFVYFAAEAFEIDKDILKKYWGFLNKDITTTNIKEKNIDELRFLSTAVFLENYESIPTNELNEDLNRQFWNLDVSVLTRSKKSVGGFLLKKATEKYVNLNSEEKDRKLW